MSPHLRHDDRQLLVSVPLDELDPLVRRALLRWLWEHNISPAVLVVDRPIERDDVASVLVWRERLVTGEVVKRWRFAPVAESGTWPAPFPAGLLPAARADEPVDPATATASAGSHCR